MLTQNGVFEMGGPICISIGEFHDKDGKRVDTWRPVMGMQGFAENVASSFIAYESFKGISNGGIRIYPCPEDGTHDRKKYEERMRERAKMSYKFNLVHNYELHQKIEEFIETYPDSPAVKNLLLKRGQLLKGGLKSIAAKKAEAVGDQKTSLPVSGDGRASGLSPHKTPAATKPAASAPPETKPVAVVGAPFETTPAETGDTTQQASRSAEIDKLIDELTG